MQLGPQVELEAEYTNGSIHLTCVPAIEFKRVSNGQTNLEPFQSASNDVKRRLESPDSGPAAIAVGHHLVRPCSWLEASTLKAA